MRKFKRNADVREILADQIRVLSKGVIDEISVSRDTERELLEAASFWLDYLLEKRDTSPPDGVEVQSNWLDNIHSEEVDPPYHFVIFGQGDPHDEDHRQIVLSDALKMGDWLDHYEPGPHDHMYIFNRYGMEDEEDLSEIDQVHLSHLDNARDTEIENPKLWSNLLYENQYLSYGDYTGGTVNRSNLQVFEALYGSVPGVVEIYGGHGSRSIGILYSSIVPDSLVRSLHGLEDHPVLDEEHLSNMETNISEDDWENHGRTDFERSLANVLDLENDLDNNTLDQLYRQVSDHLGRYPEVHNDGTYFYIDDIVEEIADNPGDYGFEVEEEDL